MKFILDTNMIIRFLANDHREHSPAAYRLFEEAAKGKLRLYLESIVVAECAHVLEGKYYQLAKKEIAVLLQKIIESTQVEANNKDLLLSALDYYATYNVDFPDAYLATLAENQRLRVATFNKKDFEKMGVNNYQPQ